MLTVSIDPLSLNNCFRGRRFITPEYKAWREAVGYQLNGHQKLPKGVYVLTVYFYRTTLWTYDVSNCIKTIEDSLVKAGIIHDDAYIKRIVTEKFKSDTPRIEYHVDLLEPL